MKGSAVYRSGTDSAVNSKSADGFAEISLDVELKKGVRSVRLSNAYAKAPDVDFMRINRL